jgi:protein-tyrosine-phosphatase
MPERRPLRQRTIMKVLFICKGNWFRSQIAEAIYNKLTNSHDASSVGTYVGAPEEPEGQVLKDLFKTPDFFEIMESHGLNIRENKTKRLTPEMLDDYDTIVSMAEDPYVPNYLKDNNKVIQWNVKNPTAAVDTELAEKTYQQIYNLVEDLIKS